MKKLLLIPVLFILCITVYGQALNETPDFNPFAIINMEVYIVNDSPVEVKGTVALSATNNESGTFFCENYTMLPYSMNYRPFATFSLTNPVYYVWMKNCVGEISQHCAIMQNYEKFTPKSRMTIYITGAEFQIQYQ